MTTAERQDDASSTASAAEGCPLAPRDQTRNMVLVGVNTALSYLAAPVLYVGMVQASLCERLGASATQFNLPAVAYLVFAAMPLLVGWLFPKARHLKPVMVTCYALLAAVSALVAVTLLAPVPNGWKIAVVILQGCVVGGARCVAVALEFEVLGRGVAPSRRGTALALAYGAGPILAIVGSLTSQLLLKGHVGPLAMTPWAFPWNFAALFAASVPIMALGAVLSCLYVVPLPADEPGRQPFVSGVFGGLGEFFSRRVVLVAMIVAVVILAAYTIEPNMVGYTQRILGTPSSDNVGYQLSIRFTFKAVAGLLLGWLLTKTNPKAGVLATATVGLAGVAWAIVTPREWYLLSFGLLGAGELFGIYITNYILCCATPERMRRYMAFTMLTLSPAALAGVLYGRIVDHFPPERAAAGFRASFAVAVGFIVLGIALALFLPTRPGTDDHPSQGEKNHG